MKNQYWSFVRTAEEWLQRPVAWLAESRYERICAAGTDAGSERVLAEVLGWLSRAQDASASRDGGVARDFSLVRGWASSYPETTGYIIPTFLDYAVRIGDTQYRERAQRMLKWLISIQLPEGGFQGGKIDSRPVLPVIFNTGQILLGLAAGARHFNDCREPMRRAADWLVHAQDADGCWRRYRSPFASSGENTYETHVAWGLFEAARIDGDRGYAEAAETNVRWALGNQMPNGWLQRCSLGDANRPLTHTIGYALRGILEAYRFTGAPIFLDAALRTSDGLLTALRPDGYLPGILQSDWTAATDWVCLTGSVQIAHCWLMLFEHTGDARYAQAGFKTNAFVRRTVRVEGAPEVRGGVKGSLPFSGPYGRYQYLNWAAKFLADSLMIEIDLRSRTSAGPPRVDSAPMHASVQ